jgi:hypothetical protein
MRKQSNVLGGQPHGGLESVTVSSCWQEEHMGSPGMAVVKTARRPNLGRVARRLEYSIYSESTT